MQRLRLLPLAVALLAAVTATVLILVLTPGINLWQSESEESGVPAGYVTCEVDPTYGIGKSDYSCDPPGPDTPQEHIVYCEGTSRKEVNLEEC